MDVTETVHCKLVNIKNLKSIKDKASKDKVRGGRGEVFLNDTFDTIMWQRESQSVTLLGLNIQYRFKK